ncbi:hypothetical protein FEM48_Zijuj04G0110000 [Ziziphus jujuba var. spinosa]|uniref:Trans-resveratrol di-O-methyltransferase-like n=1 Tax=Ziziphus jujuba var. spinosa TaxID=714518 RepID=A0A978VJH8_ZIZJJ|nr:hypothetical protein FEM48_Zijuj04G0110000 [Ziziphus jujuba var. spinosa]
MERLRSFTHLNIDLVDEENATELLHAQAHVWNHIFSFINSWSLKCAIQLGIPDTIHSYGKPITLSQLISSLPHLHPKKTPHLYRLMRILVHSGFFSIQKTGKNDEEEGYALTDASKLLLKDNPFSVTPFLMSMLDPWILHDWSDEESVKILKKCKEAITGKGNKGKVIIIDMMMENKKGDEETIETQLFFDMLMMVLVTGKERNEKEWAKLFSDAGFRNYKITPILGLRSLIEVYP